MNREAWLTELAKQVEPIFKGFKVGPYKLTCGWPSKNGLSPTRRRIGECFAVEASKAGVCEIFISPALEKPIDVAGTVCHEMAHVVAGNKAAHGPGFVKVCRHAGITAGKPTWVGPGPKLIERLEGIITKLGPYPHAAIKGTSKSVPRPPSILSLECDTCGCKITMGKKWLSQVGPPPACACGGKFAQGSDEADPFH